MVVSNGAPPVTRRDEPLMRTWRAPPSHLVKGLLDLVEVIEVVLHGHADGVHGV